MADLENNTFWISYGDSTQFEEVSCADAGQGSLAVRVLDAYGIPYSSSSASIGGELPNVDIKHMDAMQVIRQSLMEHSALNNGVWEPIVNPDGEVELKEIGSYSSGVETDLYYEIQTVDYKEECKGVMITGGKPLTERRPMDWSPIWGDTRPDVYKMDLFTTNCMKDKFSQYTSLVFKDIHFESGFEDGVDNQYYNIGLDNPYDEITGWAYFRDTKGLMSKNTEIKYSKTADIPIRIGGGGDDATTSRPDIGTLTKPLTFPEGEQSQCWGGRGLEASADYGVKVDIPTKFRYTSVLDTQVDTFVSISAVYIMGTPIADLFSVPKSVAAAIVETEVGDADVWASIDESAETVYKLDEGKQYAVAYKEGDDPQVPYIVFADLSRKNDPGKYGNDVVMNINRSCKYFWTTNDTQVTATVLPIAETRGMWVKQIWVIAQLNTPSVTIYDPDGKATQIAEQMDYKVAPIITVNAPNPIAFNGRLLDLASSKQDHDPRTSQNFRDTEFEEALDIMNGGGLTLSFSFLDEDGCVNLSSVLYEYMNSLDGIETVYVCGPNCDPQLGGSGPSGGVINSITYSYTDSGSYTISANEGPKLVGGFAEVGGGATPKAAESVGAEGTIIEDMGNHIYFKVRLDGFGDRTAINCCPSVLRVGDRVACSVHNNPIES